jgi:hypothetical protein
MSGTGDFERENVTSPHPAVAGESFQTTTIWEDLAPRTLRDYARIIQIIEKDFGDLPLSGLGNRRTRDFFMSWRDKRAKTSRRQADYC